MFSLRSIRAVALVGAALAVLNVPALAAEEEGPYAAKGMPISSFRLFPTLDLTASWDDNVFKTDGTAATPKIDSPYFVERPELTFNSQWGRHELDVFGGSEIYQYTSTESENITNWNGGARGRFDVYNGIDITADASYQVLHEPRTNANITNLPGFAIHPTRYHRTKADASINYHPYHFSFSVGGAFEHLDYAPTPVLAAPIQDNHDRDRIEYDGFAKAGYEFSPGYAAFVEAQYDMRHFSLEDNPNPLSQFTPCPVSKICDRNGILRGEHGFSVDGGIDAEVTHLIVGRIYAGYLETHFHQQPLHPNLPDVTGFDFGAALTWTPDPLWRVRLEAAHIVNDTTLNSSSEDDQKVLLNVDWYMRDYLVLQGKIGYLDANFPHHLDGSNLPSPRRDTYIDAGAGIKYIMNEWMALKLAYDFEHRDSNSNLGGPFGSQTFDDNQVSLSLLLQE
jgi:hypothetical protein